MNLNYNDKFREFAEEYESTIQYYMCSDITCPECSYEKQITIKVFNGDEIDNDVIAFMYINAYDIADIENDGDSVFYVMDGEDVDQGIAGHIMDSHLSKGEHDEILTELFEAGADDARLHAIYVKTVFVEPEFRKNGIGRFLWENYERILYHMGIMPIISSVAVKPQEWNGENCNGNIEDPKMEKHMIDIIKKNRFIDAEIETAKVYYKMLNVNSLLDDDID